MFGTVTNYGTKHYFLSLVDTNMKKKKTNIWVILLCIIRLGGTISFIGRTAKTIKIAKQAVDTRQFLKSQEPSFQKITKPIGTADKANKVISGMSMSQETNHNDKLTHEERLELEYLRNELQEDNQDKKFTPEDEVIIEQLIRKLKKNKLTN
mgnify:CR=1 FL=1